MKKVKLGSYKKLKCHLCEYIWNYFGRLGSATCPYCKGTVKVFGDKK